MYGQITKFREDIGFGVIEAEDGHKYRFSKSEIVNVDQKLVGESVNFLIEARQPKAIFVLAGSPWTAFGPSGRA